MIVSKPDFISTVADRCNFSKTETRTVLNAAEEVIAETLARNDAIQFVGFGKFYVQNRKATTICDINTGEKTKIAARKVPTFTAGRNLKAAVNVKKGRRKKQ